MKSYKSWATKRFALALVAGGGSLVGFLLCLGFLRDPNFIPVLFVVPFVWSLFKMPWTEQEGGNVIYDYEALAEEAAVGYDIESKKKVLLVKVRNVWYFLERDDLNSNCSFEKEAESINKRREREKATREKQKGKSVVFYTEDMEAALKEVE